jgi:hypothetical protein
MMDLRSDLIRATLLGLVILGIGSRLLMRVVALMQGTAGAWTFGGTITVVFLGTVSGFAAGLIYHLLRRFVARPWIRTTAFVVICGLISWRGVHGVPLNQQAMFMALALAYLAIVDVMGRLATGPGERQHMSFNLTG